jgi:hypothetical protein
MVSTATAVLRAANPTSYSTHAADQLKRCSAQTDANVKNAFRRPILE